MADDENTTRERIVLATIECIERQGVQAVTVRKIAEEAGANLAAVNYHFGSKEQLLEVALRHTLRESTSDALQELDELVEQTGDLRAAVRLLLVHLFAGMLNYPRIAQWQFNEALVMGEYGGAAVAALNGFLDGFLQRVEPLLLTGGAEELRLSVIQMWSAMLLVGMMPGIYGRFLGLDLHETTDLYVDRLLQHYMPIDDSD